jgi:aminoglycoside phosphotransferase family enzyme
VAAFELPKPLFHFYRSCRAMIRARLAIAHLSETSPRTPEKWPRLARAYLRLAVADAAVLENARIDRDQGRTGPEA